MKFLDSLVTFFLLWGIPAFMLVRAYSKMRRDEKKEALRDFRTPRFIFTIGFMVTGAFAAHAGMLLSTNMLRYIGTSLLIIGLVVSALQTWKFSKGRSAFLFMIAFVMGFVF
ncbi:hypothetical protein ACQ0QQ_00615 [Lysinibacillus sphaericus]